MKNIPTVYIQAGKLEWIKKLQEDTEDARRVEGHIFLEINLNNKWYLFDPTNGYLFLDYDYHNLNLPKNYIAYAKSLNGHEVGNTSLEENNQIMKDYFMNYDIKTYQNPNLKEIKL